MNVSQENFTIEWTDHEREPKCAPDPEYPDGIDIDVSGNAERKCKVVLPYPAKRCGVYIVRCKICGSSAACTTAGRIDDPRSITIPCKISGEAQ
jgi:hypothetical protein